MTKLVFAVVFLACSTYAIAQSRTFHGDVHCKGVSSVTTKMIATGPDVKKEDSKDEIWLSRRGSGLLVQINPDNYSTLDAKTRRGLQEPEQYRIVGETGEGVTAIHVAAFPTTEHTLILRSDNKRALWIETAFSFLPPQSEPVSTTVTFNCKRAQ